MSIKDQIPVDRKCWYAVKCKYRCEKRLVKDLQNQGIMAYVPIQKKLRQYASGRKYSECALIHSHVFVYIKQSEYLEILNHVHVYSFLHFSGNICTIPPLEMDILKRVVGECQGMAIDNCVYNKGDEVEIIAGELTGLKGQLIESTNHNFKIELISLGMGLFINVEPKYIVKIRSARKVA